MTLGAIGPQKLMLDKTSQRVLKAIHVASAGVWLGGLVAIVVLLLAGRDGPTSARQFGLDLGAHLVHDVVLFWAFVVTLATGFAFATLTPWGMFRHDWLTAKWLLAIGLFVTTLWFQNPALAIVAGLSDAGTELAGGLRHGDAHRAATSFAVAQLAVVVIVFALSTLKPWGQRTRDLPRKVIGGVAAVGLVIGGAFGVFNYLRLEHIRSLPIDDIAPATRADGTWPGGVDDCGLTYEVNDTIANGRLTHIVATRSGGNQYAKLGAAVLPRIVGAQSVVVDAITGATTTSHCLGRAVGRALRDAPRR
jgi:uncharacterized protein with FMN-binding domain